jgi:hypothetical protein
LLRAAVNKHIKSVYSRYPETVDQLMENLYVDAYLGGADEVETAKARVDETNILFSEANST